MAVCFDAIASCRRHVHHLLPFHYSLSLFDCIWIRVFFYIPPLIVFTHRHTGQEKLERGILHRDVSFSCVFVHRDGHKSRLMATTRTSNYGILTAALDARHGRCSDNDLLMIFLFLQFFEIHISCFRRKIRTRNLRDCGMEIRGH